jgi:hypothetical protein
MRHKNRRMSKVCQEHRKNKKFAFNRDLQKSSLL